MAVPPPIDPTVAVLTREGYALSATLMPRANAVALTFTAPAELHGDQVRLELADAKYLRDQIDRALELAANPGGLPA